MAHPTTLPTSQSDTQEQETTCCTLRPNHLLITIGLIHIGVILIVLLLIMVQYAHFNHMNQIHKEFPTRENNLNHDHHSQQEPFSTTLNHRPNTQLNQQFFSQNNLTKSPNRSSPLDNKENRSFIQQVVKNLSFQKYSGVFCRHHFGFFFGDKYRSCMIYNLCYWKGKYLYFHDQNVNYPLLYDGRGFNSQNMSQGDLFMMGGLEGRVNTEDPKREKLFVTIVRNGTISDFTQEHKISHVKWMDKKSILMKRHRCTNAGHCLLETIFPAFTLLKIFYNDIPLKQPKRFRDNYLVFAEEEDEECDCRNDVLTCGTDSADDDVKQKFCQKIVRMYGHFISDHSNQLIRKLSQDETSLVCWPSIVMGSTAYGLFNDFGWKNLGGTISEFRDFVYQRFHLKSVHPIDKLASRTLKITLYIKKGLRAYLRSIIDVPGLLKKIESDFTQFTHNETGLVFNIQVRAISFDDMLDDDPIRSGEQQVRSMYDTDVYVCGFGSPSFMSIFLEKGAVLLAFPNGYEWNLLSNRVGEHDLFHAYMHYQNLIYPLENGELQYEKGVTTGNYLWRWDKMKESLITACHMRVKYLLSTAAATMT
nr:unnamed protein product [Naegleria fowleri]